MLRPSEPVAENRISLELSQLNVLLINFDYNHIYIFYVYTYLEPRNMIAPEIDFAYYPNSPMHRVVMTISALTVYRRYANKDIDREQMLASFNIVHHQ